ncbi:nucleoside-diphosphate sugar epimerase [Paenibacillus sp.]|uniref:nucleoside-diphosphate sugar epimerase n=1 Tax=Paenibacillus sp. TaxID=58172 RepID=UPI0028112FA5|nr:nucleoside-diphosphate sugar epimerase [Paenibacillus sp.]
MKDIIDEQLQAMAKSQEQLARSMQAESVVVTRMASLLRRIRSNELTVVAGHPYTEAETTVMREIGAYVNALADFEEALANHVKYAIKELRVSEEE